MKDFISNLIKNIVDNPDEVTIEESVDQTGRTVFLISVADSDMGRVIGKSGKVINAIRTIARIMAIRQGIRISVDVKDSRRPGAPSEESDSSAPADTTSASSDTPEQAAEVSEVETTDDLLLEEDSVDEASEPVSKDE